jgi:hypothetical protein
MQLETLLFADGRWSMPTFPDLDSERTVVVAFGGTEFFDDPAPFVTLARAYPRSRLIGCSTSGEIFGTKISDHSIAAAVFRLQRGTVVHAQAKVSSAEDSFAAGRKIATELARPGLRAVLLLSDGLKVNGSELVRGVNFVLPSSVVVTGGLAGDGSRFERTWVLERATPTLGLISAVGLYGEDLRIGHASRGGWDIFGPERIVTRSQGSVLYELDGKPALELYKEYLGERASGLPATALLFPLSLRATRSDDKSLVRTVLAVDEATQSMTFAGDIPQGFLAQLMKANFDRLIQGASDAASMLKIEPAAGARMLSIAISCVGRRLVLGERSEEEIEAVLDVLPSSTRQVGFYSYGEISPYATGACDLHNQTMTLTTISEA